MVEVLVTLLMPNHWRSCLAITAVAVLGPAMVACGPLPPDEFTESAARIGCEDVIKSLLRDPDSYQFESATVVETKGTYSQWGEAVVKFRSRNGFGGYTSGAARCKKYPHTDGQAWHRAEIIS